MRLAMLILLGLTACAPTDPGSTEELTLEPIAATNCNSVPAKCQAILTTTYKDDMKTRQLMYGCLGWALACHPIPNPPPPAAGGATSVGGTTSTGGATGQGGATSTGGSLAIEDAACANVKRLGCPEGTPTDCAPKLKLRCANAKVTCDVPCLANAASKSELQTKCGLGCGRQ